MQGQSPYAASKIAADKLAESFYCSFNLPVATIRPLNTFGPRQSACAVIPTIISQALAGDTIRLGVLTPVRDFTFVEDTVAAFMKVAEAPDTVGQVVNIGTGQGVTVGDVANMVLSMCSEPKRVIAEQERFRPAKVVWLDLDICGLHRIQRAFIGCLVLALGLGGCASLPPLPAPAERPPLSGLGEEQRQIPPATYTLRPGDVLRVSVYDNPDLSQEVTMEA